VNKITFSIVILFSFLVVLLVVDYQLGRDVGMKMCVGADSPAIAHAPPKPAALPREMGWNIHKALDLDAGPGQLFIVAEPSTTEAREPIRIAVKASQPVTVALMSAEWKAELLAHSTGLRQHLPAGALCSQQGMASDTLECFFSAADGAQIVVIADERTLLGEVAGGLVAHYTLAPVPGANRIHVALLGWGCVKNCGEKQNDR